MVSKAEVNMIIADLDALDRLKTNEECVQRTVCNNLNIDNVKIESRPATSAIHTINQRREKSPKTEQEDGDKDVDDDLKKRPETNEQIQVYDLIMDNFMFYGRVFGIIFAFNHDWRKLLLSYHVWFNVIVTGGSIVYTQCLHIMNHEYMRILEGFSLYAVVIAVAAHWICFMTNRNKLFALMFFSRRLCLENVCESRAEILKNGYRRSLLIMKSYVALITIFLMFFIYVPTKTYMIKGEYVTMVPMEFFFCDQSTFDGFLISNAIQSYMGAFSGLSAIYFASVFIHLVKNYIIQMKLFSEDFKTLDKMWEQNVSLRYKQRYLVNICKKFQDTMIYLKIITKIYEPFFFIYFVSTYLSVTICLFEIAKMNWESGYTVTGALLGQMLAFCIMGTQVVIANDAFCLVIYDTNWYTYDVKSQMLIQTLLHQSQHIRQIMIGPIAPLNIITGISILKSIYSYYTILTEVL